jgi:hypothetical protein
MKQLEVGNGSNRKIEDLLKQYIIEKVRIFWSVKPIHF